MKTGTLPVHRIELHMRELAQLFNSMDPTPFHHRDLDPDAEEFIESWALEYPAGSRFHINVHLEQFPAEGDPAILVSEGIHNYFTYKSELTRRELNQLFRNGRVSLVIGLTFLMACLVVANVTAKFVDGAVLVLVRESLTIGGWVAMWRPMQVFFYDWWPIVRRRRIYLSLSRAQIRVSRSTQGILSKL